MHTFNLCRIAEMVFRGRSRGKKRKRAVVKSLVRDGQLAAAHKMLVDRIAYKRRQGKLSFPVWAEYHFLLDLPQDGRFEHL